MISIRPLKLKTVAECGGVITSNTLQDVRGVLYRECVVRLPDGEAYELSFAEHATEQAILNSLMIVWREI